MSPFDITIRVAELPSGSGFKHILITCHLCGGTFPADLDDGEQYIAEAMKVHVKICRPRPRLVRALLAFWRYPVPLGPFTCWLLLIWLIGEVLP